MSRELILRIKWAQMSVCSSSLLQRATVSSFNIACLICWTNIFSDMNLSKDTTSLGSSSSTHYILCLKSKINVSSLTLGRKNLRFIPLNFSNRYSQAFFISNCVFRAQGVDMSLAHKISLCDIAIVISCESSRVLAFLMPRHCLCPWNIINLICFLGLCVFVPILFGFGAVNVRDVHLITYEFRWSDGSCLYFSKVINW